MARVRTSHIKTTTTTNLVPKTHLSHNTQSFVKITTNNMKISIAFLAAIIPSVAAFAPVATPAFARTQALNGVPLANGSMEFDRVCREWRCKYEGDKVTSESLESIANVLEEYLPTIKGVSEGITVNRLICGGCLDFKLQMT
eukprot:714390-Ditylum_brightwellii.AAC.1